jgi:beta-xylosidase
MNRLILSTTFFFSILLSACVSTPMPLSTVSPLTSATYTSNPIATQPASTFTPTFTATQLAPTFTPTFTATKPAPTVTPTLTATPTEIPVFWDDFSGGFLADWGWIRENDALWSLDSEPGYLRIVLTGDTPPRNLLVRDVTHENFQIMTHVKFKPTSNYQFAGLLVYQDEKTMLTLGRAYCDRRNVCVGNGIYFDALQNGQSLVKNYGTDTQIKDEAYLRIDKNGMKFTGYYSENGTDWMMIGEHEVSIIDPRVGLITANSFIVGMTALFDYFTLIEMP